MEAQLRQPKIVVEDVETLRKLVEETADLKPDEETSFWDKYEVPLELWKKLDAVSEEEFPLRSIVDEAGSAGRLILAVAALEDDTVTPEKKDAVLKELGFQTTEEGLADLRRRMQRENS